MKLRPQEAPTRAVGYCRVSTTEQGESGLSLESQHAAIVAAVAARGWELGTIYMEVASAKRGSPRPKLTAALFEIERSRSTALVVTRMNRLARSTVDGGKILDDFQRSRRTLVILDLGVDLSTPAGTMAANVILAAAQFERDMISANTKEALARKRAQGFTLGHPVCTPPAVDSLMFDMRVSGMSYQKIADALNADRVPTVQGGARWYKSTVHKACLRMAA